MQEVAVEAEKHKVENFENVQEMVGTKPEDTETTLEEISSESLQGSVGARINNNTDIISAQKSVSSITSVEVMETVTSVGQMLEESESQNVTPQEDVCDNGNCSEGVPLVDIVVVERVDGDNALDMVSKMIDLDLSLIHI